MSFGRVRVCREETNVPDKYPVGFSKMSLQGMPQVARHSTSLAVNLPKSLVLNPPSAL